MRRLLLASALLATAGAARAQEWYIPKRTTLLKRGSGEVGGRLQLAADNDGFFDTVRLDFVPHVRYSPLRRLELYAEAPLAYSERETTDAVNPFLVVRNENGGIGDVFVQVSFEGFSGPDWKILYNIDGGIPTGKHSFEAVVPLGGGHYTAAVGQTMMKVIDPVVLFAHLGYQHTFPRRFGANRVEPGRAVRFRLGSSLALNPRVRTSLHVTGDMVSTTRLNGVLIKSDGTRTEGGVGSVIRFGWGLDWSLKGNLRLALDAIFGVTTNATDATLASGIAWGF